MMKKRSAVIGGVVLLVSSVWTRAGAAGAAATDSYSGDLFTRSTFTGDWGGARNDLAAKGITFDATVTQIEQGVVNGGENGSWEYGGRADVTGHLDTQKLGLWPGGISDRGTRG